MRVRRVERAKSSHVADKMCRYQKSRIAVQAFQGRDQESVQRSGWFQAKMTKRFLMNDMNVTIYQDAWESGLGQRKVAR